jgi:SAM-dependent methyltransferase
MVWDLGCYEHVAAELLPVAVAAVDHMDPAPGEVVLDLGCGTGNAALVSAARGAEVIGVDPSPRLLGVARQSAERRGLDVRFQLGEAADIPIDDASVDAMVSVFAVIFAPDATAAAAEMARVLRPGGRIVLTAWVPRGAIGQLARLRQELVAQVRGDMVRPAPFEWHDLGALRGLFGVHGLVVDLQDAALTVRSDSAGDYIEAEVEHSPRWVEARTILEPAGRWSEFLDSAAHTYNAANEDPPRFQITSPYVMVTARRATGTTS